MKLITNILSLIVIAFLISSCGKKEDVNIGVNKKLKKEAPKIIMKNEITKPIQPINNVTSQITKKTIAKIEQVRKKTDELLSVMEINNKSDENNNQGKADLLSIDWRNIQDHRERYSWALKVLDYEEGKKMALEAIASLTNSSDVTFSTLSYTVLAQNAGRNGDMNKVKELLEDCERKIGLNINEREQVNNSISEKNINNVIRVWKLRAALARTLAEQKFKGQYDNSIDKHSESYWHELRLKWFPFENNYKATIYADLAYALMNEGNKKEAIKQLDKAINHLESNKNSTYNSRKMGEYKKVRKDFNAGLNYAPASYYW